MSDKYFVDTNVLVYAHGSSAGSKHERARTVVQELWDSGDVRRARKFSKN